eukprot:scaffold1449_cov324-Prasinococcus_capsulatus_cf.AAC.14
MRPQLGSDTCYNQPQPSPSIVTRQRTSAHHKKHDKAGAHRAQSTLQKVYLMRLQPLVRYKTIGRRAKLVYRSICQAAGRSALPTAYSHASSY